MYILLYRTSITSLFQNGLQVLRSELTRWTFLVQEPQMIQQESKGEELSSFQRLFIILLFDLLFFLTILLFDILLVFVYWWLLAVFCSFREAFRDFWWSRSMSLDRLGGILLRRPPISAEVMHESEGKYGKFNRNFKKTEEISRNWS